jgi:hypothetical protein
MMSLSHNIHIKDASLSVAIGNQPYEQPGINEATLQRYLKMRATQSSLAPKPNLTYARAASVRPIMPSSPMSWRTIAAPQRTIATLVPYSMVDAREDDDAAQPRPLGDADCVDLLVFDSLAAPTIAPLPKRTTSEIINAACASRESSFPIRSRDAFGCICIFCEHPESREVRTIAQVERRVRDFCNDTVHGDYCKYCLRSGGIMRMVDIGGLEIRIIRDMLIDLVNANNRGVHHPRDIVVHASS